MSKFLLSVAACALVMGCAPMVWNKPGVSVNELEPDKLSCTQAAQKQYYDAALNIYGVQAGTRAADENGLFVSCMNAKGWFLGPQQEVIQNAAQREAAKESFTPTALKDVFVEIQAQQEALCAKPEFAPVFKRSSCRLGDLSIEQLSDTSKISESDKKLFSMVRKESQEIGRKAAAAYRAFGGDKGLRTARAIERAEEQAEKNAIDLYSGRVGWGEFNQRRRDANQMYQDDFRHIHGR